MTGHIPRSEILTEPQRRRRWSPSRTLATVEAIYEAGVTVSLVARRNGIQPNRFFARAASWRPEGALTATSAREEVVAASEYRAVQSQVRELQRLLGKKTMEAEILREALDVAAPEKRPLRMPSWPGGSSR